MRKIFFNLIVGLFIVTAAAIAASPFAGTWEGKLNGLPGVEVKIGENGRTLGGEVTFFFQRRGEDGKWHLEGDKAPLPMLAVKTSGKVLSFELAHHKTHGSPEYGPNAKFTIELIGPDEARMSKVGDQSVGPVQLIHRKK
jgi:hypothetical protein